MSVQKGVAVVQNFGVISFQEAWPRKSPESRRAQAAQSAPLEGLLCVMVHLFSSSGTDEPTKLLFGELNDSTEAFGPKW